MSIFDIFKSKEHQQEKQKSEAPEKLSPQEEAAKKVLMKYSDIYQFFYPYASREVEKEFPNMVMVAGLGTGPASFNDKNDIYIVPIMLCIRKKMGLEIGGFPSEYFLVGAVSSVNRCKDWLANVCGARLQKNNNVEFFRININNINYDFYFGVNHLKKPSIYTKERNALVIADRESLGIRLL